jgi:hypothetical protein
MYFLTQDSPNWLLCGGGGLRCPRRRRAAVQPVVSRRTRSPAARPKVERGGTAAAEAAAEASRVNKG